MRIEIWFLFFGEVIPCFSSGFGEHQLVLCWGLLGDFWAAHDPRSGCGSARNVLNPFNTGNGRMSELQAGLGLKSIANIKSFIEHNKKIYNLYTKLLKPKNKYKIFEPGSQNIESSYQYVVLILDQNYKEVRDNLRDHLRNNNIFAKAYFNYDFSIFNDENPINFPNSIKLSKSSICLPIGERITYKDVIFISEIVNNFFDTLNL